MKEIKNRIKQRNKINLRRILLRQILLVINFLSRKYFPKIKNKKKNRK